ncbi:hypothetical protein AG1IA_03952 [Rhizoctonia solani AG-1 IA]|uniref:Fungal specific transcription factor domain-containing protein n=1 Tax=Thanatephorus cucumeris (strain AG1-IA) TaxID=983506 RepID=L8WZ11_THACA|nr:hypothetical protein AG1IA_03952 [Rhizoctonia solani AG-1 IA]
MSQHSNRAETRGQPRSQHANNHPDQCLYIDFMLYPSSISREIDRDGQDRQRRHQSPSYSACETYQSTEASTEHRTQVTHSRTTSSSMHTKLTGMSNNAIVTTKYLLSSLNNVVEELSVGPQHRSFVSTDPEKSITTLSIGFDEREEELPQRSPSLSMCGTQDPSNIQELAETNSHNRKPHSMTPGQASLFDALLSLAKQDEDHDSSTVPSHTVTQTNLACSPIESKPDKHGNECSVSGNSKASDDVNNNFTRMISLDRNVESNTLPFILNASSCVDAFWATQMMFDPLRVIQIGRTYVFRQYEASESARWKLKLVSDFTWAAGSSTIYDLDDLPSFTVFQTHMCQQFLAATTNYSRGTLDQPTAADIFIFGHELITSNVIMNRPMFFRYDVAFTQDVPESKMHIQDYLGMQWFYGVPDRLVITLARMNALREDCGDCVDTATIRELELEIAGFRPVLGLSEEPSLLVSRLVVQECWRQAAYIYLYMVGVVATSKAGEEPRCVFDSSNHHDAIHQRMMNQPECSRRPTSGNDIIKILNEIWSRPKRLGPVVWHDLRLACLRVVVAHLIERKMSVFHSNHSPGRVVLN